jgi:hypothetical protein
VIEHPGLFLGQDHDTPCPVSEPLEHTQRRLSCVGSFAAPTETRYISFAKSASLHVPRSPSSASAPLVEGVRQAIDIAPGDDLRASAAFRLHLAQVLTARVQRTVVG